ncbi:PorV/PorQ family protein [bacterium]|nr:PorV/PorQ family protein [bacterium]
MSRKYFIAGLVATAIIAGSVVGNPVCTQAAESGDAGQAGAFLAYGAGARAIGMGRAFVGIADDATALYWNPGGLTSMKRNQAIYQYVNLIDGNAYHYLGYGHILPYIGTLGVGVVMLDQGEAEGRNTYNELTDGFTNREIGVLLGFGYDINARISAGGTFKIINQNLANKSGTGFGIDVGVMYRPLPWMNLGLNFQNLLAPAITLVEEAEAYPMNMIFGIGAKFFRDMLKLDLDISKNMEQDGLKPRFGLEVKPIINLQDLAFRGGIDDTEISAGLGYAYMGFQLDYAIGFQMSETLENMHKVSLSYVFGGFVLEVHGEPDVFSPVGINKVSVIKIQSQTKFQIRIWTLEIINEAGALVKKYSGEGSPPDHIVWDGLQDNMNPMPDGKYKVSITIEDASGEKRTSPDTFITMQSILPLGVSPVDLLE